MCGIAASRDAGDGGEGGHDCLGGEVRARARSRMSRVAATGDTRDGSPCLSGRRSSGRVSEVGGRA